MAYNLKTITKIIPFTDSDFELYIPWLEDLAREGLFVRKLYGIYGEQDISRKMKRGWLYCVR